MNNTGQITVFLSLIMSSLLLIGLTVLEIVHINTGKAVFAQASKGAMEDIKAEYGRELFDRYHLLFLDGNFGGTGEGFLEEHIKEYMEYTLSSNTFSGIDITDVEMTERISALQNECEPLKKEIIEYMKLSLELSAVESLAELMSDGTDASRDAQEAVERGKNEEYDKESDWEGDDPRDVITECTSGGLLGIVTPGGDIPSKESFNFKDFPSDLENISDVEDTDINLEDIDIMKSQLGMNDGKCGLKLAENSYGIAYALECFDFYTCGKDYNNPMKCEVEYIICGKDNDYDNLSSVVNLIIFHRLPLNFIYLLSDKEKLAEAEAIAAVIALAPGISYPVAKYLIIACWAYAEAIVEIKSLLSGNKIPCIKTADTWLTQIDNLSAIGNINSLDYEGVDGIDYKGMLMLLLAERAGDMYYRMADIIQLNMRQYNEKFCMQDMLYSWRYEISGTNSKKYMSFINDVLSGKRNDEAHDYSILTEASY